MPHSSVCGHTEAVELAVFLKAYVNIASFSFSFYVLPLPCPGWYRSVIWHIYQ